MHESRADGQGLSILLNDGTGRMLPHLFVPFGINVPASDIEIADVNHDNINDVVVLTGRLHNSPLNQLLVSRGLSGGTFAEFVQSEFGNTKLPGDLQFGDFDGDEITDIAFRHSYLDGGLSRIGEDLTVMRGIGDGSFVEATTMEGRIEALAVIDADRDGTDTLLVSETITIDSDADPILQEPGVTAYSDLGEEGFDNRSFFTLQEENRPDHLLVRDFNGDDTPDLFAARAADGNEPGFAYVSLVDPMALQFGSPIGQSLGDVIINFYANDFMNEVGSLITVNGAREVIHWQLGEESQFVATDNAGSLDGVTGVESATFADLDNDGTLDMMVSAAREGITSLIATGPLQFFAVSRVEGSSTAQIADFNGDGLLDVVTAESVLFADENAGYSPAVTISLDSPVAAGRHQRRPVCRCRHVRRQR